MYNCVSNILYKFTLYWLHHIYSFYKNSRKEYHLKTVQEATLQWLVEYQVKIIISSAILFQFLKANVIVISSRVVLFTNGQRGNVCQIII